MSQNSHQPPLVIAEVSLALELPVTAPAGLIYSTDPKVAIDRGGRKYFVKGAGDENIIAAELIGYALAGILNISVPQYCLGRFETTTDLYFCSLALEDAFRDVLPFLKPITATVAKALAKIILLDVWLANTDRNIGNLLARASEEHSEEIELVAIDFERSQAIRSKAPLIEIPSLPAKSLWPRGLLGERCKGCIPAGPQFLAELKAISEQQIRNTVVCCYNAIGCADNGQIERVSDVLVNRQRVIENLTKSEWN